MPRLPIALPGAFPRAARPALLALAGLLLAMPAAEARLEHARKPGETPAESGGQGIQPGNRQRTGCLGAVVPGLDYALFAPFSFGAACLGLQQVEAASRFAAAVRLSLPDRTAAWRAPRLAARIARLRRLDGERRHKDHPPPPPTFFAPPL